MSNENNNNALENCPVKVADQVESAPSTSHSDNNTQPPCPSHDDPSSEVEPSKKDASSSNKAANKSLDNSSFTDAQRAVVIAATCVARDRLRREAYNFVPMNAYVDSFVYSNTLYQKMLEVMNEPEFKEDVGIEPRIPSRGSHVHMCKIFQQKHILSRGIHGGRKKKELDEEMIESLLDQDISIREITRQMPGVSFATMCKRVNEIRQRKKKVKYGRKKDSNKSEVPPAEGTN